MSHESTHSLDGARGPLAHPPRPNGGQLDTAGPGPAAAPWTTGAQLDRAPSEHAGRSTGKTAGPPPGSHRQITGVYREVTGSGPCTGSRRGCARLFTVNRAPSGPQLPAPLLARGARAGPPGHFSGGSPAVHRETAGPDLDPRPAARPRLPARKPECFTGSKQIRGPPPPGSTGRAAGTVTGDSPAVHWGLTGPSSRALPDPTRARTSAEGAVFHGFTTDPRHPPTGEAPARRGVFLRRFTGGSPAVHREKPGPSLNPPPPRHGPRTTPRPALTGQKNAVARPSREARSAAPYHTTRDPLRPCRAACCARRGPPCTSLHRRPRPPRSCCHRWPLATRGPSPRTAGAQRPTMARRSHQCRRRAHDAGHAASCAPRRTLRPRRT